MNFFKKIIVIIFSSLVGGQVALAVQFSDAELERLEKGEIITRTLDDPHPGEDEYAQTIEAIGVFDASIMDVYAAVINFKEYPNFMPNLDEAKILESTENEALVTNTVALIFGKKKKYKLRFKYNLGKESAYVSWRMVAWPEIAEEESIKDTQGYWDIAQYKESKTKTLVRYHIYTDPGDVPFGFGKVVEYFTENSIPDIVKATRDFIYSKNKKN